jgi:hypothetical protein
VSRTPVDANGLLPFAGRGFFICHYSCTCLLA